MRFWIELALALASAGSLLLTLLWQEWIELLTGLDPDHGSGSAEWIVALVSFVAVVGFAALSRFEWRRAAALST